MSTINGGSLAALAVLSTVTGTQKYAAVSLAMQYAAFFGHAWPNQSEAYYDLSGSLTHLALVVVSSLSNRQTPRSIRQQVVSFMSIIWLSRLGSFLLMRIIRDGRDTRFDAIKRAGFLSFIGAYTAQALWCWIVELPVVLENERAQPPDDDSVTWQDVVGWSLWCAGFALEVLADAQKNAFRSFDRNRGDFITSGLWRYSRHPNMAGEIMLWCGLTLSTMSSMRKPADYLALLSPLFTYVLLTRGSGVPLLERAGLKRWGNDPRYQHYIRHTSVLVPWKPAPAFAE